MNSDKGKQYVRALFDLIDFNSFIIGAAVIYLAVLIDEWISIGTPGVVTYSVFILVGVANLLIILSDEVEGDQG